MTLYFSFLFKTVSYMQPPPSPLYSLKMVYAEHVRIFVVLSKYLVFEVCIAVKNVNEFLIFSETTSSVARRKGKMIFQDDSIVNDSDRDDQ